MRNLFNEKQDLNARNEQFDRSYRLDQFWADRQFSFGLTWNFKSGKAFRQRTLEKAEDGRL